MFLFLLRGDSFFLQSQWDQNKVALMSNGSLSRVMKRAGRSLQHSTEKWVIWKPSPNTRGPSCFSNSSWSNSARQQSHAHDTPLSAGLQPGQSLQQLVEEESNWVFIGGLRNHMTGYANCLYVAVEIPECWATPVIERLRESEARRKKKKGVWHSMHF